MILTDNETKVDLLNNEAGVKHRAPHRRCLLSRVRASNGGLL